MKTLIYTCIYSNLWGTEFGGRPSRNLHYIYSFLNILNLNADKFICFTNNEEIEDLEKFFYVENNISDKKLEFKIFDLKETKYFEEIKKIKNLKEMETSDRCYEVQYNKFFWLDLIDDIDEYEKIYWIDAGLSHGGIIHSKYSTGNGYEKGFKFSLFNEKLLNRINEITEDKILLLSKNNRGMYYWSNTVPEKYYSKYTKDEHIIGGMFGGNVKGIKEYKNAFEAQLVQLLENENSLYHEELIMTCIYCNNKNSFTTLKFDDWYDRKDPQKYGNYVRYFYNILEIPNCCVATTCFEISNNSEKYVENAKKLIETNLMYTDFDLFVYTNKKEKFEEINDARVKVKQYLEEEPIISRNKFNMHLKRNCIKFSKKYNYDIIFYNDCDCFIDGWDKESFNEKIRENFDVFFVSHANPQLGGLRKNFKHFQEKIDTEFQGLYTEEMDSAPNPAETRVIFKNNEKLDLFLEFWDKISSQNKDYFTYYDGVYFGTSAIYANMEMAGVTRNDKFSKHCFIKHIGENLNYFGEKVRNKNMEKVEIVKNLKTAFYENGEIYLGQIEYKGLYILQNHEIYEPFKKLFENKKPKRIIEIGTEYGGFTLFIKNVLEFLDIEDFKIRTYDIKETALSNHNELDDKIEILNKNIFSEIPIVSLKKEEIDDIKNFLSKNGVNLILCDGVDKQGEFRVLSELLKSGDIIMAHDYAENETVFNEKIKGKIWNWMEIQESDIKEASIKNDLEFFMKDEFEKVAWVCKIKK
jgi:hypothetical protein